MQLIEYAMRPSAEHDRITWMIDAKPPDRHTVDHFRAGLIVIAPGDVVARACGEYLDSRVLRQVLRNIPRVQFGATVDVGAVALHHDSELHCAEGSGSWPESARSDPGSAGPSNSPSS